MTLKPVFLSSIVLLGLSACERPASISPTLGDSVRRNMAVHIINPTPSYEGMAEPDFSGARASGVMDRYYKGDVKSLEPERTSQTESGSSKK
jgi:hypothetical protein